MGDTVFPPWTPFFCRSPIVASVRLPAGRAGLRRRIALHPRGFRRLRDFAPRDAAGVPADEAVRGDERRHALEESPIVVGERGGLVGVDVDFADHPALVDDRDDDLRAGGGEAGEIARVGVDVVDDLRPAARGGGAADALSDRNPDVLGCLRPLPGTQDEVVTLDEVDPDPRVVGAAIVEHFDDLPQHVVRVTAPVENPLHLLLPEGFRFRFPPSRQAGWAPWRPLPPTP